MVEQWVEDRNVWRPGQPIFQFSRPRTASTFQAMLLCLIVKLKSPDRARCVFRSDANLRFMAQPYEVVKTHVAPILQNESRIAPDRRRGMERDFLVFTSIDHVLGSVWPGAAYEQLYEAFASAPLREVDAYVPIFGLSRVEASAIRSYLRYWMILRQCCGLQQSHAHRMQLLGCEPDVSVDSPEFPGCEMYNLTAVEVLLSQTTMYHLLPYGRVGKCVEEERLMVESRKSFFKAEITTGASGCNKKNFYGRGEREFGEQRASLLSLAHAVSLSGSVASNETHAYYRQHHGYCNATKWNTLTAGLGGCEKAESGAWRVPPATASAGWSSLMAFCHARCKNCQRCNYISATRGAPLPVPGHGAECDWFHECDLASLFVCHNAVYTLSKFIDQPK